MARSRSKKRKAARARTSNHGLPTFNEMDSYLDRMVGLPNLPSMADIQDSLTFQGPSYTGGYALPEPTKAVPLSQSLWQPQSQISQKLPKEKNLEEQQKIPKDICVSRSERTEVMFATNKAGKSGQKSPKWTEKSKVKC